MSTEKQPLSKVLVQKRFDGKFFYALTFRGVTQPVKGPFDSQFAAAVAGQSALKALEERVNGKA